ncbi:MAG: ferredoxin-thioredoxin reductase variable chain [Synechococcales cyanobacterium]
MEIGSRVRVKKTVVVYHHPDYRSQPFNIEGMEGVVAAVIVDWNGRPVSANFPFQVQFDKRFRAHLHADEIEMLEPAMVGTAA